ncbi:hypothetical protein PU629_11510 [Pullulanibacillus sp. KACC 23026]|uniref:hypothetical protein n=1 Tax=Pullulanibacillus sp. KACC 23026 TaxID=3028315 RepID=UPI0023AF9377|nr:hypothetical protein [Pullulanibacillus sp. KACC 23026]WEG14947.1 hypothetical protein PU629_11510 [Pullulanibacillus sp. KACC 23026]
MMILVFSQWCINHDLDPFDLYQKAYPNQVIGDRSLQADSHSSAASPLHDALALTVPKEEAGEISLDTVLNVLALYGNDDLACVVAEAADQLKETKR